MEPMTLGSPVGSPAQTPGSPGPNSTYLPSYLLGDLNTSARLNIMSPQGASRGSQYSSGVGTLSPPNSNYCTPDFRTNRQKALFGNVTNSSGPQIGTEGQSGGPPTRALFDTLDMSQSTTPAYASNVQSNMSNNQSRMLATSPNMASPMFFDNTSNMCVNEPMQGLLQWVTVFGFTSNGLNAVLSHISSRVRVIDKRGPPHTQGNWIHLRCASEQDAERALACNGNIVSGSTMIGVLRCTDEGVLGCDKENISKMNASMGLFATPDRASLASPNYRCSVQPTSPRIQNARPLAVGYNQHLSPQAVQSPQNVPQKSTGLVSKAMEYVFGW